MTQPKYDGADHPTQPGPSSAQTCEGCAATNRSRALMAIDSPCSVSALQACAFPVRGSGDACADGEYYSQTYYSEPLREALPSAAACTTRRDVAHTKEETAPAAPATSSPIRDEIAKAAAYAWGKILATAVAVGTVSGTIKLMFTESMEAIENKLRKSE